MNAVIFREYESVDSIELIEVEKPVPGANDVLVKVHAASVNSWDLDIIKGIPFANRVSFGLKTPKPKIIGIDIAGQVEEVGGNVEKLKEGDDVFADLSGCGMGGFAEYVCVPQKVLTLKPEKMSFEAAAALPHTGVLALQGLRDKGHLQKGQKLLINGAGGGSGTFAVQIGKLFGAEVTCVDIKSKFEMLRSLGADHLIDYREEDFAKNGVLYDLILDVVSFRSILDYKRILSPSGKYVMLGGGSYSRVFQAMFMGLFISLGRKKMGLLMHKPNKGLDYLIELFEAGKLKPVIDRQFQLEGIVEAFRYFEKGLTCGKIVITV